MQTIRLVLGIGSVLAMAAVGTATATYAAEAEDGWAQVCCGPTCTINGETMDYCTGSGEYTCCK